MGHQLHFQNMESKLQNVG